MTKPLECVKVPVALVKLNGVGVKGTEQFILNNYTSISKRSMEMF